jgi:hypothetical protein
MAQAVKTRLSFSPSGGLMKYLPVSEGQTIPALGLGTWKSNKGEVATAVSEALKIGYRHIDCAPIYMNEQEVGTALSAALQSGQVKREDLWITSKLWNNAHAKKHVRPALEKTPLATNIGMTAPAAITPIVLPASTSAKLNPRFSSLVHLWFKAIIGAQQAAQPIPVMAKKRQACQSSAGNCMRKAPAPMMVLKREIISRMSYLSDSDPIIGENIM